jgi:hypothetical protein
VFDIRVFIRAAIVGIVLQVVLMLGAHFSVFIAEQGFLLGGMTICAVAGYLYAMDTGRGYFTSATIAAVIGAICALVGVGVSAALRDAPLHIIPMFTTICVATGAIGGLFGQMSYNIKTMNRR